MMRAVRRGGRLFPRGMSCTRSAIPTTPSTTVLEGEVEAVDPIDRGAGSAGGGAYPSGRASSSRDQLSSGRADSVLGARSREDSRLLRVPRETCSTLMARGAPRCRNHHHRPRRPPPSALLELGGRAYPARPRPEPGLCRIAEFASRNGQPWAGYGSRLSRGDRHGRNARGARGCAGRPLRRASGGGLQPARIARPLRSRPRHSRRRASTC